MPPHRRRSAQGPRTPGRITPTAAAPIRLCRKPVAPGGLDRLLGGLSLFLLLRRLEQELRDVHHFHGLGRFLLRLLLVDGVAHHDLAERATGSDEVRLGGQRLFDALGVDALADALLHPHARATRTAAEAALPV